MQNSKHPDQQVINVSGHSLLSSLGLYSIGRSPLHIQARNTRILISRWVVLQRERICPSCFCACFAPKLSCGKLLQDGRSSILVCTLVVYQALKPSIRSDLWP